MDSALAEKLRLWLVSVMTLLLGTVSASAATLLSQSCTSNTWTCIGLSSEPMAIFQLLFLVIATWHALDFFQSGEPTGRVAASLARYRVLFGTLALLLVLLVLVKTGHFHATYCATPEPGTIMFDGCETRPPRLLTTPLYLLLLFAVILCMGKAVISIRSRLKKAE